MEKVQVSSALPITNDVSIDLRQRANSTLSWVKITPGGTTFEVKIDPKGTVTPGVYNLTLEQFDANSNVKSTLKSDTVAITVESPCQYNPASII